MVEREGGVVIVVALHHLPVLSLSGRSLVLSLSPRREEGQVSRKPGTEPACETAE